jgi:hypothetical protein
VLPTRPAKLIVAAWRGTFGDRGEGEVPQDVVELSLICFSSTGDGLDPADARLCALVDALIRYISCL